MTTVDQLKFEFCGCCTSSRTAHLDRADGTSVGIVILDGGRFNVTVYSVDGGLLERRFDLGRDELQALIEA